MLVLESHKISRRHAGQASATTLASSITPESLLVLQPKSFRDSACCPCDNRPGISNLCFQDSGHSPGQNLLFHSTEERVPGHPGMSGGKGSRNHTATKVAVGAKCKSLASRSVLRYLLFVGWEAEFWAFWKPHCLPPSGL